MFMKKVFNIGGTTFDSIIHLKAFPEPKPHTIHGVPFHETIGSTGAGKALNLAKLNVNQTLHSIIGDDMYGKKIEEILERNGIDFIYDFDPKGTERHVNLMDENGGRISIFVQECSNELPLNMEKIEPFIKEADVIVLNIINYTKQLIPLIKMYNKQVWVDLHDYDLGNPYHDPYIEAADYIFLSSEKLDDYRSLMQTLINQGKELVVCTHGKKGSTTLTSKGEWIETPIVDHYPFVDANGAGDSFFSGFLYGHLKGTPLKKCLAYATICGGLTISSRELASDELSPMKLEEEYRKHFPSNA